MKTTDAMSSVARIARIAARALSVAFTLFIGAFVVGEDPPSLDSLSDPEIAMCAALGAMMAGVLLAFRFEIAGSALVGAGFAVFSIVDRAVANPFAVFPIVGVLYLTSGILTRAARRHDASAV